MKRRKTIGLLSFFACVLALMPSQLGWEAHGQSDRLSGRTITGTVYFIGGRAAGRSLPFRLIINRLTTPDEVNQLNQALQSGGQDGLLKVLSRMDAGRIQIGSDVGVPANAIIASQEGDRTKLTVLYQRNLRFAELRYGARSVDYRFGYAELYLGPGGGNQGMLIPAAMVRLKGGNTWEVEDFGTFPARLMGLQVRGKGRSDIR
jgi:hypothetical protein